jgi:hypothetical protein
MEKLAKKTKNKRFIIKIMNEGKRSSTTAGFEPAPRYQD